MKRTNIVVSCGLIYASLVSITFDVLCSTARYIVLQVRAWTTVCVCFLTSDQELGATRSRLIVNLAIEHRDPLVCYCIVSTHDTEQLVHANLSTHRISCKKLRASFARSNQTTKPQVTFAHKLGYFEGSRSGLVDRVTTHAQAQQSCLLSEQEFVFSDVICAKLTCQRTRTYHSATLRPSSSLSRNRSTLITE